MKFHAQIVIKEYVGETFHSMVKQIYEHGKDFKRANKSKSLVMHDLETNQNFYFIDFKLLVYIDN